MARPVGIPHTKEWKEANSLRMMGNTHGFPKGNIPWNKGNNKHKGNPESLNHKLGKEAAHYINGNSEKDKLERERFRRILQKQILERDDYICQICGSKKDLQVDHIQSWAEYVELRFNMDNCRTLCAKCHYQITFGKPMPKHIKGWGHNLMKGVD